MRRLLLTTAALMAVSAFAAPMASGVTTTPSVDPCVSAAVEAGYAQWVCIDGALSAVTKSGKSETREFARLATVESLAATGDPLAAASATFDDFDTWCEVSVCSRKKTAYISDTKGNGTWGVGTSIKGTFDVGLTTELNGRQAQWTVKMTKDSGPDLKFTETWVNCYEDRDWFPDLGCGEVRVTTTGGATSWTVGFPVFTAKKIYGNKLINSNKYYAVVSGRFTPVGYSPLVLTQLKSLEFTCWNTDNCVFP